MNKKLDIYGMIYKKVNNEFFLYLYDLKTSSYIHEILKISSEDIPVNSKKEEPFLFIKNQLVNIYLNTENKLFVNPCL